MASGIGRIVITANGDTSALAGGMGLLKCEHEGTYVLAIHGTIDAATTISLFMRALNGSDAQWTDVPIPGSQDGEQVVWTPSFRVSIGVPGNHEYKAVVANYDASADLVIARTKVSSTF